MKPTLTLTKKKKPTLILTKKPYKRRVKTTTLA